MELPTIGVVICSRGDRAEMLAEAVHSVHAQDYDGDVELVVVYDRDEPPADPVPTVLSGRRRVRSVRNLAPHGLAYARNHGVAQLQTDWIAFLDDDDLWLPGRLSAQLRLVEQAPYVHAVCTGIEILGPGGTKRRPAPRAWVTHGDLVRDRITELHPSSFLLRRSVFLEVGQVDTELPGAYAEDYDLLLRLATRGPIAAVLEPLVQVRWSGNSYFFSQWQTISDALTHLADKHRDDFAQDATGRARVLGQIAFAEAAMGHREQANRRAIQTLRARPRELRGLLALAVANTPLTADRVQRAVHRVGRGI